MAAYTLPSPGKIVNGIEIGPCIDECKHSDCTHTRKMYVTNCSICNEQIGYEVRFYDIGESGKANLVHASCYED